MTLKRSWQRDYPVEQDDIVVIDLPGHDMHGRVGIASFRPGFKTTTITSGCNVIQLDPGQYRHLTDDDRVVL